MAYGVMFTSSNGSTFVTPESTPMALYQLKTASPGVSTVIGPVPGSGPIMPFMMITKPSKGVGTMGCSISSDRKVTFSGSGTGSTIYCAVFAVFAQPNPSGGWGAAVWDANGTLVLTNETRVLTDLRTFGTRGVDAQSGLKLDTTVAGRWAITPGFSGYGVQSAGGPGGIGVAVGFCAQYDGANTRILSTAAVSGGAWIGSPINGGQSVAAINLANYL